MQSSLEEIIYDIVHDNNLQKLCDEILVNQNKEENSIQEVNYQQEKNYLKNAINNNNNQNDLFNNEDILMQEETANEKNLQNNLDATEAAIENLNVSEIKIPIKDNDLNEDKSDDNNNLENLEKEHKDNNTGNNDTATKGRIIFRTNSSLEKTTNNNKNLAENELINNSKQENSNGEYEYFVEKIIRKRNNPDLRYLVKWVGWDEKYSTWEPLEHLLNVTHLIDEYEKHEAIKVQKKIQREYYKGPDFPAVGTKTIHHIKNSDEDDEYKVEEENYIKSDSDTSFDYYNNYYNNSNKIIKRGRGRPRGRGRGRGSWRNIRESSRDNYNLNQISNYNSNNKLIDMNSNEEENSFLQKRTTEDGENEYNPKTNLNLFLKDSVEKKEIISKIKPREFKEKLLNKLDDNEICYNINNILDELMKINKDDSDASFQKILTGRRRGRRKKCEFIDDGTNSYSHSKKVTNQINHSFDNSYCKDSKDEKNKFSSISYYRSLDKKFSEEDLQKNKARIKLKKMYHNNDGEEFSNNAYNEIGFEDTKTDNYPHLDDKKREKELHSDNKIDFSKRKRVYNIHNSYEGENSANDYNKVDGYEVFDGILAEDDIDLVINVKRINDDLHCLVKFIERSTGVLPDDAFVPADIIKDRFPIQLIEFYESKIVFK